MRKLIPILVLGFAAFALAQNGPLTNAANIPVRTDTNGYLLAAAQTYTGPDGPRRVLANTLVRTDANGYLLITNPTGFGGGGMEIGSTVTSGTAGSVLFVGAGSVLAQDNAEFFWNNTNKWLGLGKIPAVALDIFADTAVFKMKPITGTDPSAVLLENTGGSAFFGIDSSVGGELITGGSAYAGVFNTIGATAMLFGTNDTIRMTITEAGVVQLASALLTTYGGTGLSSWTQGDIPYYNASTLLSKLAKNTTATRYLSNTGSSNNPAWAQIDLTNGVTNDLPDANLSANVPLLDAVNVFTNASLTQGVSNTGINFIAIKNASNGAAASSLLQVGNDITTQAMMFFVTSSGYTPSGDTTANTAHLRGQTAGGLTIVANHASGDVRVWARNVLAFTLGAGQNMLFGATAGAPGTGTKSIVMEDGTALASMASNTTGFYGDDVAGTVKPFAIDEAGNIQRLVTPQTIIFALTLQANLGTPANGTIAFCSDCTIANPCAGGGTGAIAKRLNGVWVCN